jgi:hypothetical protein
MNRLYHLIPDGETAGKPLVPTGRRSNLCTSEPRVDPADRYLLRARYSTFVRSLKTVIGQLFATSWDFELFRWTEKVISTELFERSEVLRYCDKIFVGRDEIERLGNEIVCSDWPRNLAYEFSLERLTRHVILPAACSGYLPHRARRLMQI